MAKERMINTRIWSDNWVSELDPIEKLLFLYFLTNSYTNISGVYELPLKVAAVETGIDPSMLAKVLPRLEPKIIHRDGWVIMPNFPRYQNLKSKDVVLGIQREFGAVPERIQKEAMVGGWGDGLGIAPDTKPNLTKLIGAAKATQEIVEVPEDQKEKKPKPKYDNARKAFTWLPNHQKSWNDNLTELKCGNLLFERGEEAVHAFVKYVNAHKDDEGFNWVFVKPSDYERKWEDIKAYAKRNS